MKLLEGMPEADLREETMAQMEHRLEAFITPGVENAISGGQAQGYRRSILHFLHFL